MVSSTKNENGIHFEMDMDRVYIERRVYGILDLLGDLGGFREATKGLGGIILLFTRFQPLNNFLI